MRDGGTALLLSHRKRRVPALNALLPWLEGWMLVGKEQKENVSGLVAARSLDSVLAVCSNLRIGLRTVSW